jgi:Protein kinase domain
MNASTITSVGWLVLCLALGVALALLIVLTWAGVMIARTLRPKLRNPPKDGPYRGRPAMARNRSVDTSAACPECGAVLPGDSPEGLCVRCLLQRAMLSPEPAPNLVSPSGAAFVAPDPAKLAPHFPQLEILTLLGQGGMGAVYKARQLKLDRFVAVKILPAEWGRDPAFAERFSREARALARLSHPHIVAVHDFGEAGGYFYLLMEYVDGANLRQILQSGPLEARTALQFIPQICDALQYAHDEGVVHRDVKPENILVDQRGRVRIADFGLAKLVGPSRASFTLTGSYQVMGTLDYMAPEQRSRPQEVDHRADIYSLGVVFYEMLTGELPLGRFSPPSQTAGVDGRLDEIVHRALEREPEQRYQHVSEVRSALESVSEGASNVVRSPDLADTEYVQLQVQGPAAALVVTALAAVIFWVTLVVIEGEHQRLNDHEAFEIIFFSSLGILAAGAIVVGAVKLRRFEGYGFVIAAIILAMLPVSPHCLIGIPAGIWALWTLRDPKVKAAFAAKLRRKPRPTNEPAPHKEIGAVLRKARSFWRSFCAVFYSSPRQGEPATPAPQSAVDETSSPR